MNSRTIAVGLLCSTTLVALTGTLHAQEDHLIENQRYVVGIDDFSWGDTYVGKYTSGNGLIVQEYISGTTNPVNLTVNSLQIGNTNNSGNYVDIYEGGTLTVKGPLSIMNTNPGEGLTIHDKGTLDMMSDFDAAMAGFSYDSGAKLQVGGEVSNLDNIENGLNFTLTGENATWAFGTNTLTIGALSSENSASISNQANVTIDNILIGSGGSSNNYFIVTDGGRTLVNSNITISGTDNYLYVTNAGILAVDFDFDASVGVDIQQGGILEAHKDFLFGGVTNGGGVIMDGPDATWTNLSGATLLVGTTNDNSLIIKNDATVRAGSIVIGDSNTESNNVYVTDGGNLIVESGTAVAYGPTNALWVTDGGILTLEGDATLGGLRWGNGGIIEAYGAAPFTTGVLIGNDYVENGGAFLNNGKILKVVGPAGRLYASGYDFHVGDLSANNALILTNGALGYADSLSIGDFKDPTDRGEGGNNNSVVVTGTGSILDIDTYAAIGGTMDSGVWYEGGISNSLTVADGGQLLVGTTLHNRNTTGTSGLNIKPNGLVEAANYYQAAGAYLMIYTDASGTNSGLLRVTNTAEFEEGANVGFDAISALSIGKTYTNMIVEAGTLVVGGVTNTTDLSPLENGGGSLVNYDLWTTNQDIYATFTRRAIADGGGIKDNMLTQISDEIDRMAGLGNAAASNQVAILSKLSSTQVRRQMEQTYRYQLPTFMHNKGVFGGIDQVKARGTAFHGEALPMGAKGPGPHDADQGLQGWAKIYGNYGSRDDGNTFNDGYNGQVYGTVIGLDQAFNDWLFGVAGGYASSTLDGDNGDQSDASTGYGMLYASYGTKDWFGDLVVSYGQSDIDNSAGGVFHITSSTEASQTAFYLGVGKEFKDPEGSDALLRPLLAMQASQYDQDGYTEKSPNAVAKNVDGYDRWSYQSIFGAEMVLPTSGKKFDIEAQLRLYWLHEYNDSTERVDYTLVGSSQSGRFILRSPVEDSGQVGVGCVAKWDNGVQLRADLDGQVSDNFYSTTLSGALLYEF